MMEYIQKTYGGIGMKNNKKILMFSSILILLFICIAFVGREFQNDTFYTIKIGKSILKHGIDGHGTAYHTHILTGFMMLSFIKFILVLILMAYIYLTLFVL